MHTRVLFLEQGPERTLHPQRFANGFFHKRAVVIRWRSLHSMYAGAYDMEPAVECEEKGCSERDFPCRYLVGVAPSNTGPVVLIQALASVLITSVIRLVALFSINSDLTCK